MDFHKSPQHPHIPGYSISIAQQSALLHQHYWLNDAIQYVSCRSVYPFTAQKKGCRAALSLILQNSTNLKNFYSLQTKQIRLSHSPSNKLMEVELPLCQLEVVLDQK